MEKDKKTKITIEATVEAPAKTVWKLWTTPEDIIKWNSASDDWHTTRAENNLRKGGKFVSRMEAKDGSMGFDLSGVYDVVIPNTRIAYTLEDDRKVDIHFEDNGEETHITQTFEAESENPVDMQRDGWQAILNNFKKYAQEH
ncbi:MAG: SRPBCC family protein [Gracilimonas sp.]|uniref:SRPBCC family protein n=1 Tax=Gracilimonas sp. TaxID=1974203 RepID=UPI003751C7F9|nr:SRPBCC family protein [Gracilimonas sp.]